MDAMCRLAAHPKLGQPRRSAELGRQIDGQYQGKQIVMVTVAAEVRQQHCPYSH